MKKFTFILAILSMVCLAFVGCKSDSKSSDPTDLSGTKWQGKIELTNVVASFSDTQCTMALSGYATGKIIGSYTSNGTTGEVTITSTTGDAKDYVSKGQHITLDYNLTERVMKARMYMFGSTQTIDLIRID